MILDLYVDTSRKGISMALASADRYEETVNPEARGETLGGTLDDLLNRMGATLDDVKRVMVTLGPGSFSGLRTGVAFCQGLRWWEKHRLLTGRATIPVVSVFIIALCCPSPVLHKRNGFWYLRLDGEEFFIETEEAVSRLEKAHPSTVVIDEAAQNDPALSAAFSSLAAKTVLDTGKPLNLWAPLFDTVKPSLIQEANYIQPSYFEKLKV